MKRTILLVRFSLLAEVFTPVYFLAHFACLSLFRFSRAHQTGENTRHEGLHPRIWLVEVQLQHQFSSIDIKCTFSSSCNCACTQIGKVCDHVRYLQLNITRRIPA